MFKPYKTHKSVVIEDFHNPRSPSFLKRLSLFLILITAASLLLAALSQAAYAESAEHSTGEVRFRESSGTGQWVPSIQLSASANIHIAGMVANVELRQSFANPMSDWGEAVYTFPLPENAAVTRMTMRVGERVIEGRITERSEAKVQYEAAKKAGKKAALVEQERPNLFTQSIANIAPGETVEVTLRYQQTVDIRSEKFSLRLPTTLTPRYIPGQPLGQEDHKPFVAGGGLGWASPTDQVIDADRITPSMTSNTPQAHQSSRRMALSVSLDAGLPLADISGTYHDLDVSHVDNLYHIQPRGGDLEMNRDFELTWQFVTGSQPKAAWLSERKKTEEGFDHYGLLMVHPPQVTESFSPLPRQLILIVDTSGSMAGTSINQAKASVTEALSLLSKQDSFEIIEFNSTHRALFSGDEMASAQNLQRAHRFVNGLHAGGGTEMRPALETAMAIPEKAGHVKQIVFITDGSVGNEQALFTLIQQQLGNGRLFTVGIGSAPNSHFMRRAADFGRGSHTYIGKLDEVQSKMSELMTQLSSPVMTNIRVDWPFEAEVWPKALPDLYAGEPLILNARYQKIFEERNSNTSELITVSGQLNGQPWQRKIQLSPVHKDTQHQGAVASLWARKKLESLLGKMSLGISKQEIKEEALPLALEHSLLSPFTSFLAIEEVVSRTDETLKTGTIPNVTPAGQMPSKALSVPYPKTATGIFMHLFLGFLASVLLALQKLLPVLFKRRGAR